MQKRMVRHSLAESSRRWFNYIDEHLPFFLGGYDRAQRPIGHPSTRDLFLSKPPIHSKALFLNGGSSYVDFGDTANIIGSTTYTIEFWLNPGIREKWARIFAQGDDANASHQVTLLFYENAIALFDGTASPISMVALSKGVWLGWWQHFAFVRDGASYAIYRNGQDWKDSVVSATCSSDGGTVIGTYGNGTANLGRFGICDFRVWSVARTQAQVQANLKGPIDPATSGLVSYWHLDDGGTTVDDKTSGARDGTIFGPGDSTTTYGHFWYPHS